MRVFRYHGRYRRVDLERGSFADVPFDGNVLRQFIGGVGLGTYVTHRESPPRAEYRLCSLWS